MEETVTSERVRAKRLGIYGGNAIEEEGEGENKREGKIQKRKERKVRRGWVMIIVNLLPIHIPPLLAFSIH